VTPPADRTAWSDLPVGGQWRALALRLTVLVLPSQLLGAFLGFLPILLLGRRVVALPWLSGLVLLGMGLVAGAAIGRLAHPPRDRVRAAIGLTAVFGLVSFLVLRLLVQLRLPEGSSPPAVTWVVGSLVVVLLQSLAVALVWRRRASLGFD
jgi:hypothetical protein